MFRKQAIIYFLFFFFARSSLAEGVNKIKLSQSFASFIGENKYDNSSGWLSTVGDINGDGFDDLMVGARNNDEGGDNTGKYYLFFGKPSGWKMDIKLSQADITFMGEAANDLAGMSGSMLGDVDGDGIDDFILGASYYDGEGENIGKAYLFFGRKFGWEKKYVVSSCDVVFYGERDEDHAAGNLSSAGDVNGDGLMDFLISAKDNDDGGENAGKIYLVFGKTDWPAEIRLSEVDASFLGRDKGDTAGGAVAGAGDVNGDGYDDFLIGAQNNAEQGAASGQVYLILGKKSGWKKNFDLVHADVVFSGEKKGNNAGAAVSPAGDVDNDGISDFLISAPNNGEGGRRAGKVYLIYGRRENWKRRFPLAEADASFIGEKKKNNLGKSLACLGDVTGDGLVDFLISAPRNSEGGSRSGKIYLFQGKVKGRFKPGTNVSLADYQFTGEKKKDYAGGWISYGGDINGDGALDFLVGADSNGEGGKSSGQGYVISLVKNVPPSKIDKVSFKSDATFQKPLTMEVESGDTLHIEVRGEDADPDQRNILPVMVGTGKLNQIRTFLVETEKASGVFQGKMSLSDTGSNTLFHRLSVKSGDTVIAKPKTDQTKYSMVSLKVAFDSYFLDDDNLGKSHGNNNHHPEAGETIEIKIKLVNHYFETTNGLRAELTSSDPYITVKKDILLFDEIKTGKAVFSKNAIMVSLADNVPTKHRIPLNITVTSPQGNRWEDIFFITIEDIFLISGRIVDRETQKPLSGIKVTSHFGDFNISDDTGRYVIHITKLKTAVNLTYSYKGYLDFSRYAGQTNVRNSEGWENVDVSLQRRISLDEADVSFLGVSIRDASGASVSYAGDVNGDGFDDLLIGAWGNDDGGIDSGKVYVIFGKSGKWDNSVSLTQANASFIGEKPYDEAGRHISYAGDVNNDGFDDFLIGASGNDESGDKAGQVYLILGKAVGWAKNVPLYHADASYLGQKPYDRTGEVSFAGDVNGDGYDDFLIAGWSSDQGGIDSGQVYLIFGQSDGWMMDYRLNFSPASFIGEKERDEAGKNVSWVGDVNGDGYDDFLIGAPSNSDSKDFAGKTYLIFGRPKGWRWSTSLRDADVSFMGEDASDASGSALSGLGDVNGDGFDDFLIGAWSNDSGGIDAGKAYLFLGRASGWHRNMSLAMADASFVGEETRDAAALKVSYAGDVNGDGYNDLFIGAWGNDYGHMDNGQSYVIFGKPSGWKRDMPLREADLAFFGKKDSDSSGRSLSYAGDFNGDGIDDLIVGAWSSDTAGVDSGESHLIFVKKNVSPQNIQSITFNIADSLSMPDPMELNKQSSLYSEMHLSLLEENWFAEEGKTFNPTQFNQLYVMLHAEDTQPDRINIAEVFLNSPASIHDTTLKLYETDNNSGKFLGRIKITATSSSSLSKRILAHGESYLTITSKEDGAKYSRIFIQDKMPPVTGKTKPGDQEKLVSISATVVAHIKDPGSGVDKKSIKMFVDDVEVQPTIEGSPSEYRLTYIADENFSFGSAVKILLKAGDLASPSNIASFPYTFHVAGKGIFLNPGFEQEFTNWNFLMRPGITISIDSTQAHTGLYSCRLEFSGMEDIKYQHMSQGPIAVKPDTGYLLRCYIKSEKLTSESGVRLYVEGSNLMGRKMDKRNFFNAQSREVLGSNDWEEVSVSFATLSDTTNIVVYVVRWDAGEPIGGICWLDDFYLMEDSEDGYTGSKIKHWFSDFFLE